MARPKKMPSLVAELNGQFAECANLKQSIRDNLANIGLKLKIMTPKQRQPGVFHEPLRQKDTVTQTEGCRHTNPDICANNQLFNVCAFVRADKMCMRPPRSWARQYERLLKQEQQKVVAVLHDH